MRSCMSNLGEATLNSPFEPSSVDLELRARALAISTPTLHEAADQTGALPSAIRSLPGGKGVCGFAVTVECPPRDNLWIHRALYAELPPHPVLVVSVGDAYESGYWGEILARAAVARGVVGLVIDGCVRDSSLLTQMQFPVFARGTCIRGTAKKPLSGGINGRLRIGEVDIHPGDLIVGDVDGVVVVPLAQLGRVVQDAEERQVKEAEILARLDSGERTLDIYGFAK